MNREGCCPEGMICGITFTSSHDIVYFKFINRGSRNTAENVVVRAWSPEGVGTLGHAPELRDRTDGLSVYARHHRPHHPPVST